MLPLPPTAFNAKDAVVANDALVAKLAVPNNEPVIEPETFILPVTVNPLPEISKLPVITAEPENGNPDPAPAFKAKDAVVANDAVPNNEPVKDPLNDPVLLKN